MMDLQDALTVAYVFETHAFRPASKMEASLQLQSWDYMKRATEATTRAQRAEDAHNAFLRNAGEVAMRYARDNNWCGEVQRCLGELGVPVPSREYRWTVTVELEMTATLNCDNDNPSENFVLQSLRADENGDSGVYVTVDDDWDDGQILSVRVLDVANLSNVDND